MPLSSAVDIRSSAKERRAVPVTMTDTKDRIRITLSYEGDHGKTLIEQKLCGVSVRTLIELDEVLLRHRHLLTTPCLNALKCWTDIYCDWRVASNLSSFLDRHVDHGWTIKMEYICSNCNVRNAVIDTSLCERCQSTSN